MPNPALQKPARSNGSVGPPEDPHPDGELGEYKTSRGWDPNRSKIDEREVIRRAKRARERHARQEAARSAIDVRTATDLLDEAETPEPRRDLFSPFWREGELAVLTGPPGTGKSLLAMQLAAAISAGKPPLSLPTGPQAPSPALTTDHRPLTTLYIDLERTPRQIAELYAAHKFPERLEFGLLEDIEMPESYNGRRDRFYLDAISHRLAESDAPVVIIDNLSWLTRSGSSAELHSVMKAFRRWVNDTGRSMLVLHHSRDHVALYSQPAAFEMAHSIFALNRSTMGDNVRYLKSLRSPTRLASCETPRLTSEAPGLTSETPRLTKEGWHPEPELGMTGWFSPNTPFDHQRDVLALRTTTDPYPGFQSAGVSPEEFHLYDYTAHAKRVRHQLDEIYQLNPPRPDVIPKKPVKFLAITDGKPSRSGI